jgi:transcriptional regulator with XRE-family HTH domain
MARQARYLGEQLARLRGERDWKGKDVVAAMAELGDLSLNTNQLSRYENGGAWPNEVRLGRFAEVFGVEVSELLVKPKEPASDGATPAEESETAESLRTEMAALRNELLGELGLVQDALAEQRSLLETVVRNQESPGS